MASSLTTVPNEVLFSVAENLPTLRDVKNFRLTCRRIGAAAIANLRLERVFISANPLNVQVLRSIADHDQLRFAVNEIIWDDARFIQGRQSFHSDDESEQSSGGQDYPDWFGRALGKNHQGPCGLKGRLAQWEDGKTSSGPELMKQGESEMPAEESWQYYQYLLMEQDEVLNSEADVGALRYALRRFPNLRRITLTPAAHGFLFLPKYQTPMIRNLPYGFNYLIPRGWPTFDSSPPRSQPWKSEEIKNQWRGFRVITRLLAEEDHQITEFIINVHYLDTGLNYHIFDDQSYQEYQNFTKIISRPGFRRLDLSLLTGACEDGENWTKTSHRNLRHSLSLATDLEHFSLHTNVSKGPAGRGKQLRSYISPSKLFPAESWPRLHHFGVSGLVVDSDGLVQLLSKLPLTLRSVELSFLYFKQPQSGQMGDSYKKLLIKMRDGLDWCRRERHRRPTLTIGLHFRTAEPGKAIWLTDEATAFIYGEKDRLFGYPEGPKEWRAHNQVLQHEGNGIHLDEFDPEYRKAH